MWKMSESIDDSSFANRPLVCIEYTQIANCRTFMKKYSNLLLTDETTQTILPVRTHYLPHTLHAPSTASFHNHSARPWIHAADGAVNERIYVLCRRECG